VATRTPSWSSGGLLEQLIAHFTLGNGQMHPQPETEDHGSADEKLPTVKGFLTC
jgi:hypothetical protein